MALDSSTLEDIRTGQYKDWEGNVISMLNHETSLDAVTNSTQLIPTDQTLLDLDWKDH